MQEPNLATRIAALENDNLRLRRLLSQTNAPHELRHRLSSTIAMLRTIIRKSADTSRDIEIYVAHVEDRMNAIARAQANADALGEIELGSLLANELLQYGASEGKRSHLSGPTILFQPRAGQVMTLAAHELAINALEHGALTAKRGAIDVAWTIEPSEPGNELKIVWKETGVDYASERTHEGFGTEVLMRMLTYEFGATTTFHYEPDGLRCVIRFNLTDRIGREDRK